MTAVLFRPSASELQDLLQRCFRDAGMRKSVPAADLVNVRCPKLSTSRGEGAGVKIYVRRFACQVPPQQVESKGHIPPVPCK